MSTLYLDLFSGISGDMFLGAALDLGMEAAKLETELARLGVEGYHLHVSRQTKGGIAGTKFDVHLEHDHHHHGHDDHGHAHGHHHEHLHEHEHHEHHATARTFAQIRQIITESKLSDWVKEKSIAVFQRVAVAEGTIHGHPPDEVHFHEVGAIDSIVDIVGACIALDLLGRPQVVSSAVVEGTGSVKCAHGRLPLPAPATLEILAARGVRLQQCEEPHELVTPTGAAILAEFVESFGAMPNFVAKKIGYGLGTRENLTRPNVLRAVLCETDASPTHNWESDTISVLETNLDDINAELLGAVVEKALSAGALDVFHTPIQMKKSRPGVLLTVLCTPADADRFTEMLLVETSAFGVRRTLAERRKLRREIVTVQTPFGAVEVKLGRLDGRLVQTAPEFESCRRLAAQAGVPLKTIYDAAIQARAGES